VLATLAESASVRAEVRHLLREALRDKDVGVRSAALGALTAGATEDDLAAAVDAYSASRADRDADARLAFWPLADSALRRARAGVRGGLTRRLEALERPADSLERMVASRIPRYAAWRDSTGAARPLEWYLARIGEVDASPAPVARIETVRGVLELQLHAADAPLTVHNFVTLARRRYFDGQRLQPRRAELRRAGRRSARQRQGRTWLRDS
jgi:hypothetical protein